VQGGEADERLAQIGGDGFAGEESLQLADEVGWEILPEAPEVAGGGAADEEPGGGESGPARLWSGCVRPRRGKRGRRFAAPSERGRTSSVLSAR
jgi:hypothetical protein